MQRDSRDEDSQSEQKTSLVTFHSRKDKKQEHSEKSTFIDTVNKQLKPADDSFPKSLETTTLLAVGQAAGEEKFHYKNYYSLIETDIMIYLDHLDGVESKIILDPDRKEYPTGIAYYRDAAFAKPIKAPKAKDLPSKTLVSGTDVIFPSATEATTDKESEIETIEYKERPKPGDRIIESQNMLLRALNTLRGIDHVLETRKNEADRQELLKCFAMLIQDVNSGADLKKAHTNFNSALIRVLHKNKLDAGLESAKDYQTLLLHYRDLASTIDVARSFVTVTKFGKQADQETKATEFGMEEYPDGTKFYDVTETDIAHPITVKTETQLKQLAVMKQSSEEKEESKEKKSVEKNFHNTKKEAFKIANQAFADLIADPDRRLPPQSRKMIGPTAKNAYLTNTKLTFKLTGEQGKKRPKEEKTTEEQFHSLRSGSMVYVGSGATEQQLEEYTEEIMLQIKLAAEKVGKSKINFTMLVTDISHNDQDLMLRVTKNVASKLGCTWVHAPTNFLGKMHDISMHPDIQQRANKSGTPLPTGRDIGNKANRINKASEIVVLVNLLPDGTINLTACASGKDRTGTIQERATELWEQKAFASKGIKLSLRQIEDMRAPACHQALLATFSSPGSPGMNKDSHAKGLFASDTDAYFYRKSAKTNKSTPIDAAAVAKIRGAPLTELATPAKSSTAEEKIGEQDVNIFYTNLLRICTTYSGSKSTVPKLRDEIIAIGSEKLPAADKLQKMIKRVMQFWNDRVDHYKKENTLGISDTDYLITKLNSEPGAHSSLRNLGELIQATINKFPQTLKHIKITTTNLKIIPHTIAIKNVSIEQIIALQKQIAACQDLVKPKTNNNLNLAAEALKESKNYDADFSNAIMLLNNEWIRLANANTKKGAFGKLTGLFDKSTAYVKSEKLISELNKKPETSPIAHAIGSILQNINKQYGDILNPPIKTLNKPFEFKSEITVSASATKR